MPCATQYIIVLYIHTCYHSLAHDCAIAIKLTFVSVTSAFSGWEPAIHDWDSTETQIKEVGCSMQPETGEDYCLYVGDRRNASKTDEGRC